MFHKSRAWFWAVGMMGVLVAATTVAQDDPVADDELSRHMTTVRSQIENKTLDLERREELALEMAATLDRAAQRSPGPIVRRRRWSEAIDLLDWFLRENPDPPRERQVRFQAGVLRWAQARSWAEQAVAGSRDNEPRREALTAFDNAIDRLRTVAGGGNNPALAENFRFRLAEALADRADLEPTASTGRLSREAEALDLLGESPAEPGLSGYWHLLKADLLRRSKKSVEAEKEVDAAIKSKPAPPASEIVEVNVPLLIDLKRYSDAINSLATSQLERPVLALWMARIRLAQLGVTLAGAERFTIESDLFGWIKELRAGNSLERRQVLLDLAKAALEPDPKQPPEVWDSLAEAYGTASEPARAGAEMVRAADRAAALGQATVAAGYWLRAGGFFFQAGQYLEADRVLSPVVDQAGAGPVRAKAGMLRSLARGRAVASGLPGASAAAYSAALAQQIRDFPGDPSTNEARWLLGQLTVAAGDRGGAEILWSAIALSSPRWLDSRLAIAALDRGELDRQQINPERHQMMKLFERSELFLADSIRPVRSDEAAAWLSLARARLNLTPLVGKAEAAREICERISRLPGSPGVLYQARLYRLVALVEMGRYAEAEREAQSHSSWRVTTEVPALFDAIRLIDQCATTAESDLRQRRFGLVLKLLVEPLVISADEKLSADQQSELAMRFTRALLLTGDDRDARRSVVTWHGGPQSTDDRLLRDLGDTYRRLEAYTLDVDVQRLRLKNNPSGSIAWLDARYALALAYFHNHRLKEAAQLIDSTSILHPELGGNALHDKFIHLRQRIGVKP